MYSLLLFLHLTSVAIWFGGLVMLSFLLVMSSKKGTWEAAASTFVLYVRLANRLFHPSASVVLVTGVVMLTQLGLGHDAKPFWIKFMELTGWIVIIGSLTATGVFGRRLRKRLERDAEVVQAMDMLKVTASFRWTMILSAVLILCILFVVSLKIT